MLQQYRAVSIVPMKPNSGLPLLKKYITVVNLYSCCQLINNIPTKDLSIGYLHSPTPSPSPTLHPECQNWQLQNRLNLVFEQLCKKNPFCFIINVNKKQN